MGRVRPKQKADMMEPALQAFLDSGVRGELLFVCAVGVWLIIYWAIFEQFFDV